MTRQEGGWRCLESLFENLWAKESLSFWTEAANVGLWQYLSPWFIWHRVPGARTGPLPVTAHFQSGEAPRYSIQQMPSLHSALCVCASWLEFHARYLGDATEGKGNAASSQPTLDESRGTGRASRCVTVGLWMEGWMEDGIVLLKIIYVFCLFLNQLSLNQKQWHVWLNWKFLFTSSPFGRVHFIYSISQQISTYDQLNIQHLTASSAHQQLTAYEITPPLGEGPACDLCSVVCGFSVLGRIYFSSFYICMCLKAVWWIRSRVILGTFWLCNWNQAFALYAF